MLANRAPLSITRRPAMRFARLAALLLSLCVASTAGAQTPAAGVTLFGRIQDAETRAALPYLPVRLQTEHDSVLVAGGLANEAGAFTLAGLRKGVYVLVVRSTAGPDVKPTMTPKGFEHTRAGSAWASATP